MTDSSAPHDHEIEELLGAYALDAVNAEEATAVEVHLTTCPRCRAELDAYREMAAALGNTVIRSLPTCGTGSPSGPAGRFVPSTRFLR